MFSATKPLVVRTLSKPVRRELRQSRASERAVELAAAREALLDTRDAADRVVDAVVNRLLKELSW